ncbi:MAG: sulfite exporter TauE/SafE family protein [Magnetococcales bacterium]|nr:sulfite exporter TauE/SafE family protein [Magnetococcales bacterium]
MMSFLLGLTSGLHCLGMCGGIVGALTLSLSSEVRSNRLTLSLYLLAINSGRLFSYVLAGIGAGLIGQGTFQITGPAMGHPILQSFSSIILMVTGLYLTGRFPYLALLEHAGIPLWSRFEPWFRRLIPVRSWGRGMLLGLIWGWLPCFLVYSSLLRSLATATPMQGGLTMMAFGIGTLPANLATGFLTGYMMQWRKAAWMRWSVGLFFVAAGLVTLPRP